MSSNIVIIPSSVSPTTGVFSSQERFEQTIETIRTVRENVPNSFIILNDISIVPAKNLKEQLFKLVDAGIDSDHNPQARFFSERGLKSPGELVLFSNSLRFLCSNLDVKKVNRIFKLGARCKIKESFDINEHVSGGTSYVFKPLPSWMDTSSKLYITRLWSMSSDEITNYLTALPNLLNCFSKGYDTEHSHYICFGKKTKEIDKLHVECKIAPDGSLHED